MPQAALKSNESYRTIPRRLQRSRGRRTRGDRCESLAIANAAAGQGAASSGTERHFNEPRRGAPRDEHHGPLQRLLEVAIKARDAQIARSERDDQAKGKEEQKRNAKGENEVITSRNHPSAPKGPKYATDSEGSNERASKQNRALPVCRTSRSPKRHPGNDAAVVALSLRPHATSNGEVEGPDDHASQGAAGPQSRLGPAAPQCGRSGAEGAQFLLRPRRQAAGASRPPPTIVRGRRGPTVPVSHRFLRMVLRCCENTTNTATSRTQIETASLAHRPNQPRL